MPGAVEGDTASPEDAAFDEAAIEVESFVGECLGRGYSALVVFGILEAHRYALHEAAPADPIMAMADILGRAETERGKGQGRIPPGLRQAVRPPSASESVVDPSSGFRGVDHQFTEGSLRLDGTLEPLFMKAAESGVHPLPIVAVLVMWTEIVRRVLKEGGTSWWALKKAEWSAHAASHQMLESAQVPG